MSQVKALADNADAEKDGAKFDNVTARFVEAGLGDEHGSAKLGRKSARENISSRDRDHKPTDRPTD
jgi:hypothetical protein